jgi:Fe-S-cluster containining protein
MSTEFQPLPFERFAAFHRAFDGEGNSMWDICAQCGGRCEQHKVGTLMPGEKEFIAAELDISVLALEAGYLDRLVTPRGAVDVLKLKAGCPFLDACFHCTLADSKVKPVLCEVYPVVFEVADLDGVDGEPQVTFLVDEIDCPLIHLAYQWKGRSVHNPRYQEYRAYFETVGIERLRQMKAPAAWYGIVAQYDAENFDYDTLERARHVPATQYDTFTLDELMACRIGHDL